MRTGRLGKPDWASAGRLSTDSVLTALASTRLRFIFMPFLPQQYVG
jgi:hypothetical protein